MAAGVRFHNTGPGRVFDVFNFVFLGAAGIVTILPFLYVMAGSFAPEYEILSRPFFLWPNHPTTESYAVIFSSDAFVRSVVVTVCVTAVGTLVHLACTVAMAYPLAKRGLPGRNFLINMVLFAMVFGGGMIPTYLVVRALGLLNSYWALILPGAVAPFALIVIKNFFQELPGELEESAKVDGATEVQVLWHILLPLSKPVLATFSLFFAVALWNDYMGPLLYLSDPKKWPLQMFLRQVTVSSQLTLDVDPDYEPPAEGIKFAVIACATVPILLFYPFLQKHFAKGMLIGSTKG